MEEKDYLELLDKAYEDLPEVLYKRERFEIPQVSGRIVKTRTMITNFRDITKTLSRKEDHFSKFMLRDLGVRGEVSPRGDLILHSKFQPGILNKGVENYFKQYVQCPHCNSPDTEINEGNSQMTCKACGHVEKIVKL